MIRHLCALILVLGIDPGIVSAVADDLPDPAMSAKATYDAAVRDLRDEYAKSTEKAKADYLAKIDEQVKAETTKGNLDGVLALKAERDRFEKDQPATDAGAALKMVLPQRVNYEQLAKKARAAFDKGSVRAHASFLAALDRIVKEETQAGRIDSAKATRDARMEYEKAGPASLGEGPESETIPVIPPALLASKLAGKASYDQKSGVLTLTYNFSNRKQLQDFECGDVKPTVVKNVLQLDGSESIRHVVRYETLTVTAVLGVKQMKGNIFSTSDGTVASTGGQNPDTAYLQTKGAETQYVIVPDNVRTGWVRVGLMVTEKKASFQYGQDILTRAIDHPSAGQVTLHGGQSGFSYGTLVISGKVNPVWAAAFLGVK